MTHKSVHHDAQRLFSEAVNVCNTFTPRGSSMSTKHSEYIRLLESDREQGLQSEALLPAVCQPAELAATTCKLLLGRRSLCLQISAVTRTLLSFMYSHASAVEGIKKRVVSGWMGSCGDGEF